MDPEPVCWFCGATEGLEAYVYHGVTELICIDPVGCIKRRVEAERKREKEKESCGT